MSAAVASEPESAAAAAVAVDSGSSTARTLDGAASSTAPTPTAASAAAAAAAGTSSPSQSTYAPSTTSAASSTASTQVAPAAASKPAQSTAALSKTQQLTPSPPSQPATARPATVAPRSSNGSGSSTSRGSGQPQARTLSTSSHAPANDAPELAFYKQELIPTPPEVIQPLPQEHFDSLPASALRAHVTRANADALKFMRGKHYQSALDRLRRAEHFGAHPRLRSDARAQGSWKSFVQLRAATYNNLAILFRSVNNLRLALFYANKALRMEINFRAEPEHPGQHNQAEQGRPNPAATHLNMCAILSSMGRHSSALLHAECALSSLYMELHTLAQMALAAKREKRARAKAKAREAAYARNQGASEEEVMSILVDSDDEAAEAQQQQDPDAPKSAAPSSSALNSSDKSSLLHMIAVAYFNCACEQEFLKQYRASTHSYRRAQEFATKRLGSAHIMTRIIHHAYEGAANLHPLRITSAGHSMHPQSEAVLGNLLLAKVSEASKHNKFLAGSLAGNRMVARHIPVRMVPINTFLEVAGMPGRKPGGKNNEQQQQQQPRGRGARNNEQWGSSGGGEEQKEGAYDFSEEGPYPEDGDDDGAEVSEADLRARQASQRRQLQQQTTAGSSLHPSYPPPQGIMNPEEEQPQAQGSAARRDGGGGAFSSGAAGTEEAGYWSDPEVAPVSASSPAAAQQQRAGNTAGRTGRGSDGLQSRKQKQDPRTTQAVSAAQFSKTGQYRHSTSVLANAPNRTHAASLELLSLFLPAVGFSLLCVFSCCAPISLPSSSSTGVLHSGSAPMPALPPQHAAYYSVTQQQQQQQQQAAMMHQLQQQQQWSRQQQQAAQQQAQWAQWQQMQQQQAQQQQPYTDASYYASQAGPYGYPNQYAYGQQQQYQNSYAYGR